MKKVADAALELDLSEFSRWLLVQGVPHRIAEEDGRQVIFMPDDLYEHEIQQALERYIAEPEFRSGINEQLSGVSFVPRKAQSDYPRASFAQAPLIYVMMAACALVAYFTNLGQGGALLRAMLIVDPFMVEGAMDSLGQRAQALLMMLNAGHVWRLFSPDFLHFSAMHITFNMLMLWVLGGQLEIKRGSAALFVMVLVVSITSNIAQLLDTGYLFGGMSGVVYGLVGYCWMWKRASANIFLPDVLFRFCIVWLLIGYTPLTEWLGLGRMANSAHLYGLISGLIWGWLTTHWSKNIGQKKSPS